MTNAIYTLEEFLEKAHISEEQLQSWQNAKLIKPVGYSDKNDPIYSEESLLQVDKILKLSELGYELEDIQKIIRKIGLPQKADEKPKKSTSEQFFTVGHLAERLEVSPRTIKHWESLGIIEPDMRSEGGFRLYSEKWVFLCELVKDLQLFGYSLEHIKSVSDYTREFFRLQQRLDIQPKEKTEARLNTMLQEINILFERMNQLKDGIQRWEDLLKKKKKEINTLKTQNQKRATDKGGNHE